MEIPVYNKNGEKVAGVELSDDKFGGPIRTRLLRDVVVMYEASKRQGNACTKTKGEVAGGGKKPWVQKHTGRARAGSIRSPLWKGGGASFGPKPRDYSYSIPKKAKKQALISALASKVKDDEMVVIDKLDFVAPKTKQMVDLLKSLKIHGDSCLIVTNKLDKMAWLSTRNIPYVKILASGDLNAYEVLKQRKILLTRDALDNIG